jgi:hypothetical protein
MVIELAIASHISMFIQHFDVWVIVEEKAIAPFVQNVRSVIAGVWKANAEGIDPLSLKAYSFT